ncbi:hypothetical protein [Moorena sp. SIO3F7]|uniref:hypothetical protein n=1 Tax=Moorena sp. SIO3F7 TaxID=2607839 RepID=UPI0025FD8CFC|nr:hypothetical protein [Moorena sp. SIO3F7]
MATVSCPTPPVAPATSTLCVEVITPAPQVLVLTGIANKYIVVGNRESGVGSRESGSVGSVGSVGRGRGEMGRWGDGEMGRWGDGEMGVWEAMAFRPRYAIALNNLTNPSILIPN